MWEANKRNCHPDGEVATDQAGVGRFLWSKLDLRMLASTKPERHGGLAGTQNPRGDGWSDSAPRIRVRYF